MLLQVKDTKLSWADAEARCQESDAHLAIIKNQATNDEVQKLVHGDSSWIGLSDEKASMQAVFGNVAQYSLLREAHQTPLTCLRAGGGQVEACGRHQPRRRLQQVEGGRAGRGRRGELRRDAGGL